MTSQVKGWKQVLCSHALTGPFLLNSFNVCMLLLPLVFHFLCPLFDLRFLQLSQSNTKSLVSSHASREESNMCLSVCISSLSIKNTQSTQSILSPPCVNINKHTKDSCFFFMWVKKSPLHFLLPFIVYYVHFFSLWCGCLTFNSSLSPFFYFLSLLHSPGDLEPVQFLLSCPTTCVCFRFFSSSFFLSLSHLNSHQQSLFTAIEKEAKKL